MVAVVNGYVCFTSCDAEKARQGKDPNAKPGEVESADKKDKKSPYDSQPATLLDGALKDLLDSTSVVPADTSQTTDQARQQRLDISV
jgi:hypothetical protein